MDVSHRLILTPGDPAGIGPEITVKALQRLGEFPASLKLTVIGSMKALEEAARLLKLPLPEYVELPRNERGVVPLPLEGGVRGGGPQQVQSLGYGVPPLTSPFRLRQAASARPVQTASEPWRRRARGEEHHRAIGTSSAQIQYVDIESDKPGTVAYQSIDAAVKMITGGKADALVTGPISKRNLSAAGYDYLGHTEILEELARKYFNAPDAKAEMLFVYKKLRLLLLTRHIALSEVPKALAQPGAIAGPIKTLIKFLRARAKVSEPKIAMLGVNPHSGEVGGDEEQKLFAPVMKAVNAIGNTQLAGPFAADGFFRALDAQNPGYDAIVAAYHDQGLIPFKMLAGYEAVNVTIGLPFIRTSVSHGTAEDIAGQGIANEQSLIAALHAALEMM